MKFVACLAALLVITGCASQGSVPSAPSAAAAAALIQDEPLILKCTGWTNDVTPGMLIEHSVVIKGQTASVDALLTFDVEVSPAFYVLQSPSLTMKIDRLTGQFVTMTKGLKVFEFSRPTDPGCIAAKPRF